MTEVVATSFDEDGVMIRSSKEDRSWCASCLVGDFTNCVKEVESRRFLGNDPSKCVLDKLQASQIGNRCASKERVTVVESRTYYRGSYCLASLRGEGRSDVTECTNVKVRCLACFGNLFVKRHPRIKMNTQIFD